MQRNLAATPPAHACAFCLKQLLSMKWASGGLLGNHKGGQKCRFRPRAPFLFPSLLAHYVWRQGAIWLQLRGRTNTCRQHLASFMTFLPILFSSSKRTACTIALCFSSIHAL